LKKINKYMKNILVVVAILILSVLGFLNSTYAANINSALIYDIGDCGQLLRYKGIIIITDYVQYDYEGRSFPAYCLDKNKIGAQGNHYTVSVEDIINDVKLWRIIINGYPYKSIEELGVLNKEEAFTATKQAIYCYIHENTIEDYEGIGEAGQRTLEAMRRIITNAESSKETQISNTIRINKNENDWKQDNINKNYLSKVFSVSGSANIQNYMISLTKENGENIKVTDLNNVEKQEFTPNENFKVLIPIKDTKEEGEFTISVKAKIETKPVLYGVAPNSSFQDYALTALTYEDGSGVTNDKYPKNETRIVINKLDEETNEKLKNVGFELLDENKEVVLAGLKTNENGNITIENVIPGKYYLRETETLEGYVKVDELIEIEIALNEQMTITVNNQKDKVPEVEIEKRETEVQVKRLPVAGM